MYPYDRDLSIILPDLPGVVVVKSALPPESLMELLARYYLSAVEYVTHITSCVSLYGVGSERAVEQLMGEVTGSGACFSRVRIPRAGSIGKGILGRVRAELRRYARGECGILSLEAFGVLVCFGPVIYPPTQPSCRARDPPAVRVSREGGGER